MSVQRFWCKEVRSTWIILENDSFIQLNRTRCKAIRKQRFDGSRERFLGRTARDDSVILLKGFPARAWKISGNPGTACVRARSQNRKRRRGTYRHALKVGTACVAVNEGTTASIVLIRSSAIGQLAG
jgi:hypothetical protein